MAGYVTFVGSPDEEVKHLLKSAGIPFGTVTEPKVVIATNESVLQGLPQRVAGSSACLVLYGRFTVASVEKIVKEHGKDYNITVVSGLHGPEQLNVVSGYHAAELNAVFNAFGKHEYLGSNPVWAAMLSLTERHLYAVQTILAAESLAIGAKAGLDTQILYDAICGAAGSSWAFKSCGPDMLHASESTAGVTVEAALADLVSVTAAVVA